MDFAHPCLAAAVTALALTLAAAGAHADPPTEICQVPDPDRIKSGPSVAIPQCAPPESVYDLADRTYMSVVPTGNTTPAGKIELRVHELGFHNTLAIGVTDHIEISVSAPVIPLVASANVRVGLLPRTTPYRLVLSAGAWQSFVDDEDSMVYATGGITAAYQGERSNFHVTLGAGKPFFDNYEGDKDVLTLASVGGVVKATPASRFGVFAEFGSLSVLRHDTLASGLIAGVKFLGVHFDVDVGLLLTYDRRDADIPRRLPLLSVSYRS